MLLHFVKHISVYFFNDVIKQYQIIFEKHVQYFQGCLLSTSKMAAMFFQIKDTITAKVKLTELALNVTRLLAIETLN